VPDPRLGARLAEEEAHDLGVLVGEELERHRPPELAVEGPEDPPHAALAETFAELVALVGRQRRGRRRRLLGPGVGTEADGGGDAEERVGELLGGGETAADLGGQLGIGAGDLAQVAFPLGAVQPGGGQHDVVQLRPGARRPVHPAFPSSPWSQTRAAFQSRTTVRVVTSRISAVSSTDRPAK